MASAPYAVIAFFMLIVIGGAMYAFSMEIVGHVTSLADEHGVDHSLWDDAFQILPFVLIVSGMIGLWVNAQKREVG